MSDLDVVRLRSERGWESAEWERYVKHANPSIRALAKKPVLRVHARERSGIKFGGKFAGTRGKPRFVRVCSRLRLAAVDREILAVQLKKALQ